MYKEVVVMLLEDKTILKNMKKGVWGSFVCAFLIILFAVVLILNPSNFISVAINIFGYGAIFVGVLFLVYYFRLANEKRLFNRKLFEGVLLICFGIVAFFLNDLFKEIVTVLLGGYLLYQSVSRLELAFNLEHYTKSLWIYLVGISIINIVLSMVIMINPFKENINTYLSILLIVTESLLVIQNLIILIGVRNEQETKD